MPSTATQYASRFQAPDLLQRDQGGTLTCPVYRSGALVKPDSGTFTLKRGATALVNALAVSFTGDVAEYTVGAPSLAGQPLDMRYHVEWALVMPDGNTRTLRNDAGVVRAAPTQAATDLDLSARHSNIARALQGTGETDFQKWLDESWVQLTRWLIRKGNRPELVISSSDLLELHTLWTLKVFYGDLFDQDERYSQLYRRYAGGGGEKGELREAQDAIHFVYDSTDDGVPDPERRSARPQTFLGSRGDTWYDSHGRR